MHLPLNVLPEHVLQVALPDDQQSSVYAQGAVQFMVDTTQQQKQNQNPPENPLQSITTKLNEPLNIEIIADGSMLPMPGGQQRSQHFVAASESEILGPPLPRVCVISISLISVTYITHS